jgi:hypothetical protein
MAVAFETLATKHPEHRNRWISDDKWIDVIHTNNFALPSKEREEELKLGRKNMVKAVGGCFSAVAARHRRFHADKQRWRVLAHLRVPCHDRGWRNQKGGKPSSSMPPNQGETAPQNQELPRFLKMKMKMRWTIAQIA